MQEAQETQETQAQTIDKPVTYYRIVKYGDTKPPVYGLFITNDKTGELCFAIDGATAPIQSTSQQLLRDYAKSVGFQEESATLPAS